MDNLSANANDVINVLLDRSKEQERTIAILQVNLQDQVKENENLRKQLDEAKAKLPDSDKPEEQQDPSQQG